LVDTELHNLHGLVTEVHVYEKLAP